MGQLLQVGDNVHVTYKDKFGGPLIGAVQKIDRYIDDNGDTRTVYQVQFDGMLNGSFEACDLKPIEPPDFTRHDPYQGLREWLTI